MKAEDIIGTWRGGGQELIAADGSVKRPRGAAFPAYLIYTPRGDMMVLSTAPSGVPACDPAELSTEGKAQAAEACVAYYGRYEIKGGDVLHHVEVALFPGWVGKTRVRHATLEGDRLTFITEPEADGTVSHIYWERI